MLWIGDVIKMGYKIIVAEDEPITRMDICGMLVSAGYYVVGEASNGLQAVELSKRCRPDLVLMDLTEIKEKDKELILKAVAIREIHHRVKNNLQTIASILRLQSRRIDSIEAKKAFDESINRILSIAMTHEVLSQKGIDDVDIKTILSKIKDNATRNSIKLNKKIIIKLYGDSLNVNSDKATSIAIVVNELIENSLEHGFTEENEGIIEIIIKKGIAYSNISISDNGRGFDTKLLNKNSLGLKIVRSIVKDKLSGDINIESNKNGTKSAINFNN